MSADSYPNATWPIRSGNSGFPDARFQWPGVATGEEDNHPS